MPFFVPGRPTGPRFARPEDMCGWPPARKDFLACMDLKVVCGHVSGLLARPRAAGPDGFRGSRPDQAREVALPHVLRQVSLDPSVDRRCHHTSSPSQVMWCSTPVSLFDQHAVSPSRPGCGVAPRAAAGQDWPQATAAGARAAVLRAASTVPGSPRSGHG
jgi:hypothetical protein